MTDSGDGSWLLTLHLEPREYAYDVVFDGKPTLDPSNAFTRWVGGSEHSRLTVPDCNDPLLTVQRFNLEADGTLVVAAQYVDGKQAAGVDPATVRLWLDETVQPDAFNAITGAFALQVKDLAPGKHVVRIEARDVKGRAAEPLYLPGWVEAEPFEWQDATLYFAFTDRFRNGNPGNDAPLPGVAPAVNFEGGDFAGITRALEEGYFDKLGVRAIWISPVNAQPHDAFPGKFGQRYSGYHGYWPSEPRELDPHFGTWAELKALTAEAHRRGIRVVTDLVLNHVHRDHPYFRDHAADGWFNLSGACNCGDPGCDWETRRLDCWFAPYLPDLDWRSPAVARAFGDDAEFWLEEAGFDGFRLDAVKHLEHTGSREISGRLRQISDRTGTEFYLVGETFAGMGERARVSEYIDPHQLDGQFDFPLYWSVVDAFAKGGSLTALDAAVRAGEAAYPPYAVNSPFLGNHDVPRFLSLAAGQVEADSLAQAWGPNRPPEVTAEAEPYFRARCAFAFLLGLPGVPLIYYGDELGMAGAGDPDNRRLMPWNSSLAPHQAALLETVQKLGVTRSHSRGMRRGPRQTLAVGDDYYVFQRDDPTAEQGAVVAINRGTTPRSVPLTLQGGLGKAAGRHFVDALAGGDATLGGSEPLILAPRSVAVYQLPR